MIMRALMAGGQMARATVLVGVLALALGGCVYAGPPPRPVAYAPAPGYAYGPAPAYYYAPAYPYYYPPVVGGGVIVGGRIR
jgi:hypothetical protein